MNLIEMCYCYLEPLVINLQETDGMNTLTRHLDTKDATRSHRNDEGYAAVMIPGCVSTLARLNKPAANDKLDHTYFEAED